MTRIASITAGVALLLLWLIAVPTPAPAHAQVIRLAQLDLSVPRERLEIGPPARHTIEPVMPSPPRIESRPREEVPPLSTPSAEGVEPLSPGDPRSQAVAHELQRLTRAAYAGGAYGATATSAQAAWLLGLIHLHGAGVRVDAALAEQWFARAARQGREPWAFAGLAWCAIDNCAGPSDLASADRAIARLRASHPARADFLAWLLASRQHPLQAAATQAISARAPDPQLLERAAKAGDIHANIELGIEAFAQQQPEQAAQFFRRAAARSPAASANLRELELRASVASSASVPSAAAQADATAALAQARKYHRGEGVPANFSEAIRFYRLAEQRGSLDARRMVALIFSRPAPDGGLNVQWMQQLANADTASSTPSLGVAAPTHQLQREPTPLFDLLPAFWQKQMTSVGR